MGILSLDSDRNIIIKNSRFVQKGDSVIKHPVGQSLLSFIELDLDPHELARQRLLELINDEEYIENLFNFLHSRNSDGSSYEKSLMRNAISILFYTEGLFFEPANGKEQFKKYSVLPIHNYLILKAPYGDHTLADFLLTHSALKELQNQYRNVVKIVLDADFSEKYHGLSSQQRFYLLTHISSSNIPVLFRGVIDQNDPETNSATLGHCWEPDITTSELMQSFCQTSDQKNEKSKLIEDLSDEELQAICNLIRQKSPMMHLGYNETSINQILAIEFTYMVHLNMRVKRCGMCGKYFILKGKHEANYCSRIYNQTTRTCQQVAASRRHEMIASKNLVNQAFRRAYKRTHNMMSRNPSIYSKEDFDKWKHTAEGYLAQVISGKIPDHEAIEFLNNLKMLSH